MLYTILIVDDDINLIKSLNLILKAHQFNVIYCTCGNDAIEMTRQHIPDLIITDLCLPDIHGKDICRILKMDNRTKSIPIIMLTGLKSKYDRIDGLNIGADDYIYKAF